MDEVRKIVTVLTLSAIVLALAAPAPAQMRGMPMEQSNKDMMAALMDTKDTSMAASIMKTAGLEGMIMPDRTYTLFVASDMALATSPRLMSDIKEKMKDRQTAIEFVKGHMVSGMVMPDGLTDGKTLTLMNGKTMTVRITDGRVKVDDATIIKAVKTKNGMIYVMDRIPGPIWTMMAGMGLVPLIAMPVIR